MYLALPATSQAKMREFQMDARFSEGSMRTFSAVAAKLTSWVVNASWVRSRVHPGGGASVTADAASLWLSPETDR
jgi:hypothetical protein